jgi:hypothetical protein
MMTEWGNLGILTATNELLDKVAQPLLEPLEAL